MIGFFNIILRRRPWQDDMRRLMRTHGVTLVALPKSGGVKNHLALVYEGRQVWRYRSPSPQGWGGFWYVDEKDMPLQVLEHLERGRGAEVRWLAEMLAEDVA